MKEGESKKTGLAPVYSVPDASLNSPHSSLTSSYTSSWLSLRRAAGHNVIQAIPQYSLINQLRIPPMSPPASSPLTDPLPVGKRHRHEKRHELDLNQPSLENLINPWGVVSGCHHEEIKNITPATCTVTWKVWRMQSGKGLATSVCKLCMPAVFTCLFRWLTTTLPSSEDYFCHCGSLFQNSLHEEECLPGCDLWHS